MIQWLEKIDQSDIRLVGGKAASLGELLKAGFTVPPGFVITTAAYEAHQREGGLPEAVRQAIEKAFAKLGSRLVAVRSSAVAEDGAAQSWAGVLETYLNTTQDTLTGNILRCWQSMNSPLAKQYGAQSAMAIVVQAMVPSDVSGVAFSAHPVTKNKHHIYIESVPGLGEALVGGESIPDSYLVDKQNGTIIDRAVTGIPLSDKQLDELSQTVSRIETHYAMPVDVEWAFAAGTLYILQARPITTL